MRDDAELLRRYVEFRSEADFTELVGRYLSLVYHAALRRTGGRAGLAGDVTQQVFTAMAGKAAGLIEHPVLAGWLYATTRHVANTILRAERRRQRHEQEAHVVNDFAAAAPAPEWEHLRGELDGVMDQLPVRDREAILLRFFHGRAFAHIGAAFGLSEDAARKRVDRALDRLRERLVKRGITSTSAALAVILSGEAARAAPAGLTQTVASTALEHAAGTGLPALGLLHFMSTKTTLGIAGVLGLAGILGIPAVGIAVYETREARHAEGAMALAQQEYDAQAAQLKKIQRDASVADQRLTEVQTNLDKLRALVATAGAKPAAAAVRPAPSPSDKVADPARADGDNFIATFSQVKPMLMEIGKAQIRRNFAGFYRFANLTPAQIDELETRTAEFWLGNIVLTPNSIHPANGNLPDDQLRQVLGDDGFQRMQDFKRLGPAYGLATQIALAVGYTATPLSPEQSDQVVQAITGASSAYQSGRNLDQGSVDWAAAQAQAKAAMTPAQWQAAEPVFLTLQYQQKLNQAQRAALTSAGKP